MDDNSTILKPTPEQIAAILAAHKWWIEGKEEGKRANLSRANLSRANLYGANLYGANLYGANLDGANLSRANLSGANLSRANLSRANLYGANLDGANLSRANLDGANLDGANLDGANLSRANLYGANLSRANLYGANLDGANLDGANLSRANLDGANLETGEKWEDYLAEVVPALLVAGGKTLDEVLASGCWQCHAWTNCPMHVAFGISDPAMGPLLLRPRIDQFVRLFDARLFVPEKDATGKWVFIPAPKTESAPASATPAEAPAGPAE